jgi:hypothetical protein
LYPLRPASILGRKYLRQSLPVPIDTKLHLFAEKIESVDVKELLQVLSQADTTYISSGRFDDSRFIINGFEKSMPTDSLLPEYLPSLVKSLVILPYHSSSTKGV